MRYKIVLSPEAVEDWRALEANLRATVRDAIETHLRHTPAKTSKSRIKQLRGLSRPRFRLRVDVVQVYYDVAEDTVEILAIIDRSEADAWLAKVGETQ